MDTKLLSIIIPTYNMEKYLPRCLDSLLIKEDLNLLEVWVVNDGSKDKSSEIGHQYADKYPGVFHVIDKPNGNYGSCINAALKVLTGKYVKVLDSDDYFNTEALMNVIKRLKQTHADVVLTNFTMLDIVNNSQSYIDLGLKDNSLMFPDKQIIVDYEMHTTIYKSELLRKHNYYQTEGISYTDTEWTFYPFLYAHDVVFFQENLYQYIMGREGQTIGAETFCKHIEMMETILKRIFRYLSQEQIHLSPTRKNHLEFYLKKKVWQIYYNELVRREQTNVASLKELDDLCKLYDKPFYYSLQHPFYKKYYITFFRKGFLTPVWIRSLNKRMAHWLHKLRDREQ